MKFGIPNLERRNKVAGKGIDYSEEEEEEWWVLQRTHKELRSDTQAAWATAAFVLFTILKTVGALRCFRSYCNVFSLFLSGWSHFAQLIIAVVSKDPKKSKNSGREQIVPSADLIVSIGENLFGIFDKFRANLSPFCEID
ncbi:hypothetical protein RHMOL_Rhmol02G0164000 [Rhododendron molle]|uniref:Uncharacterized protein n=9 Tax=Rhododendron molle TaxID=49168 RepID=A0ACC0PSJ1_RHOML|nr:hypothetical protein RHMOL_Rhmol02G0164000 [Rhododendron molle]KAI8567984.1 hypothetical protein RHMOL_Rhmol02G0164000 [Rhododendron molle]KAI8567985.1 hypothetical protein RHMOL_Rhmol02G0164000 [Rhododendron molle]KAI8567986.1 hypothetical protein RHMOL_Rhmol02G0164000 [Rhododendron molle]KAI8567987.1 hypothetical protein RHMOL_Rhmol02G0164000 [Rhododendron molle]